MNFIGRFKKHPAENKALTGGGYSFFFGSTSAGRPVTERSAMQMTAVYACVRILCEAIAGLPLHVYHYEAGGSRVKALDHPLYVLLHDEPNPEMTSFVFRETLMTHLLLWGNAYAQVIRNGRSDVVPAAQIYNMLLTYPGSVTVRLDGLAASAASVIAMAGEHIIMSPVSMPMIHNPATMAAGDKDELGKAITMLDSVKESIINAYQAKTGLSRAKLAKLMDAETWMDARAELELGFADQIDPPLHSDTRGTEPVMFNRRALGQKIVNHYQPHMAAPPPKPLAPTESPDPEPPAQGFSLPEAYFRLGSRKPLTHTTNH